MTILLVVVIGQLYLAMGSEVLVRQRLALTIYNDNFALVKDVRNIAFDMGESQVSFTDVASNMITETVMFKPLQDNSKPETRIRIYEQNYENNLASKYSLLKKYLEKNISIDVVMGKYAKNKRGSLLAYENAILLKTLTGVDIYQKADTITLDNELSEGLLLKPTLVWRVFSPIKITVPCEVSYRTSGLSWKADYILVLDEAEEMADMTGWVSIDNLSGKRYENTTLKLIAGEVNTVNTVNPKPLYRKRMYKKSNQQGFSEKSFGDYHMYTLSRRVDVNESSQKQIEFIPTAHNVSINKYYSFTLNTGGIANPKIISKGTINFLNEEDNQLGMPLPKGIFRVFKRDSKDKSLEFIGEDTIDHTPKNENITVKIGNAFDIISKTTVLKMNSTSNGYDALMRLQVANRGDKERLFRIQLQNYYADNLQIYQQKHFQHWKKESTHKYTMQFEIEGDQTKTVQWFESKRT